MFITGVIVPNVPKFGPIGLRSKKKYPKGKVENRKLKLIDPETTDNLCKNLFAPLGQRQGAI